MTGAAVEQEVSHLTAVAKAQQALELRRLNAIANDETAEYSVREKAANDALKIHDKNKKAEKKQASISAESDNAATGDVNDGIADTLPEVQSETVVDGVDVPLPEVQSADGGSGSIDTQPTGVDVAAHEAAALITEEGSQDGVSVPAPTSKPADLQSVEAVTPPVEQPEAAKLTLEEEADAEWEKMKAELAAEEVISKPVDVPAPTPKEQQAANRSNLNPANRTVTTLSGRVITPPNIRLGKNVTAKDSKAADAWLRTEAIVEAKAVGNEFAADQHSYANPDRMTTAEREGMHMQLFGEPAKPIFVLVDQPAKTPAQPKRTASEAAVSAVDQMKGALDSVDDAVNAILGDLSKKLKEDRGSFSNKDVDEETYAKLEPIFNKIWKDSKGAFTDSMEALKSFYKEVTGKWGEAIEPYAKRFYIKIKSGKQQEVEPAEVKGVVKVDPIGDIKDIAQHISLIADRILPMLSDGKDFSGKLTRLAAEWYGVKPADILTGSRTKSLQEGAELAVVRRAREIASDKSLDADAKFEEIKALYAIQPNLSERTSTSMTNQAYSTPAPVSFAMQEFLDLLTHPKLNIYEPTAGTGMLVYAADPKSVSANEIGADRLSALEAQGLYQVTSDDGRRHIANEGAEGTFSRVIANPPFGKADAVSANGFPLSKLEHQIMADALSGMTDSGKAAFIIGGHNFKDGVMTSTDRVFLNYLYSHYNVVHNIDVFAGAFDKQGTGFATRVIAVEGRKPVPDDNYAPKQGDAGAYKTANTVDELRALLRGEAVNESKPSDADNLPELSGRTPGEGTVVPAGPDSEQHNGPGNRDGLPVSDNSGSTVKPDNRPAIKPATGEDKPRVNPPKKTVSSGDNAGGTDSELDRLEKENPTNQHQVPYAAKSKGPSGFTLVPKNVAESLTEALDRIAESNGGDLDEFVRKELQYDSTDELFKSFAAEQIDALAMSLHNMKIGKGMIIGDMTGIGKGRVVAGIIRHTLLNGKVPIFVTEKPKLFSDMWRDLVDIGTEDRVNPLLMASNADGHIVDAVGTILQKIDGGKANTTVTYQRIATQGKQALEEMGRNAVFVTYSQFAGTGSRQRPVLAALAPDSVIILDEAHNAGGEDAKPTAKNPNPVSIAQFIRGNDVLGAAAGVIYSSATFAKRPDNMPLYFRTALGESGMSPEQLTEVMQRGGVALQQFISAQLTKAGDMIRREQDFSKIARFERKVITEDKQRVYDRSDAITEQLRDMMHFAEDMAENFPWDEVATENGQEVTSGDDGSNVGGTDFSSGVHNLIGQIQLSLKADAIVKEALAAIEEGYKPVIGLMNTMESFLSDYAEQTGIRKGDKADFSFNDVLVKMLNNGLRYNVTDARGVKTKHYATEEQLERIEPDMFMEYRRIKDVLRDLPLSDMPASPIDYIKQQIADKGHTIREITGRNMVITDGELTSRDDKDRNTSVNGFNNGPVSALVINRAGATGLSLHPTEKTGDKRPRRMIIAQADLNIDTFIQMLGRIFRKGQIHDPEYIMLSTALPSETRPAIVVEKKMQSMNANTSANDKSGFSSDIPDMVNQYGDQVVRNWLQQNFSFATALGINPESEGAHGDMFKKTTGRMGLMAALDQENFWAEIVADYKNLIEEKDALGQNDLVAKNYDFKAETVNRSVIHQGTDESNPFTASAVVEEIKATMPGKPYTSAEIIEKIDKATGTLSLVEFKAALVQEMTGKADDFRAEHENAIADLEAQNPALDESGFVIDKKWRREKMRALTAIEAIDHNRTTFVEMMRSVDLGKTYQLSLGDGETMLAVPFDIRVDKGNGNPLAPSKIKVMYAIPNGNKMLAIGMNRKDVWGDASLQSRDMVGKEWDAMDAGELRRTRHVITGNVLQGFSALTSRAQLVNFTRDNGTSDQGILLPTTASIDQLTANQTAGPERVAQYLSEGRNRTARDKGNDITVMSTRNGDVFITVPGSKQRAGKYFLDRDLLALTGDFRKSQGRMTVSFSMERAGAALARLDAIGARFTIPSDATVQPTPRPASSNGPAFHSNPFLDPASIVKSLSGLKENLQEDMPKLIELGKEVYAKSKDKINLFLAGMRKHLGAMYDRFSGHMVNVYREVRRILSDERGVVGPDINAGDDTEQIRAETARGYEDQQNFIEKMYASVGQSVQAGASNGSRAAAAMMKVYNSSVHMVNYMSPLGNLQNKTAFLNGRDLAHGKLDEINSTVAEVYKTLDKANDTGDMPALHGYFTTKDADVNAIKDKEVRVMASAVKRQIIEIGDMLVDKGWLDLAKHEETAGSYLPRVYLKHILGAKTFAAWAGGKKLDKGYTKQRKDIPEEVRRIVLGEITDGAYLAARAVSLPLRDLAVAEWLESIASNQENGWVLPKSLVVWKMDEGSAKKGRKVTPFWLKGEASRLREQALSMPTDDARDARKLADRMDDEANATLEESGFGQGRLDDVPKGYKKLPDSPRYGALRGMVVRQEIYSDIVGTGDISMGGSDAIKAIAGFTTRATSLWKFIKVALNPPTQAVNFVTNMILLHLSGVPFIRVPQRMIQAVKEIRNNGPHWQAAKRRGVRGATFASVEMGKAEDSLKLRIRRDDSKSSWIYATRKVLAVAKELGYNKPGELYQFMEAVGKTAKIIDMMEREGADEETAGRSAHEALFDYSLVPGFIRVARMAPIGAPFVTFAYKVIPTMLKTAATKPWRFAPYYTAIMAMQALAMAGNGDLGEDDLDRIKESLPDWIREKGHTLLLPMKDKYGRWQVLDFGKFLPWMPIVQISKALSEGDIGKAGKSVSALSGPVPDLLVAINTGKDPFTKLPIVPNIAPTPVEKIIGWSWFLQRLAFPSFLTDRGTAGKMYNAITDKTDQFHDVKTTPTQAIASLAGVNITSVDPEKSRAANIDRIKIQITALRRELTHKLRDNPGMSAAARLDLLRKQQIKVDKTMEQGKKYISDTIMD